MARYQINGKDAPSVTEIINTVFPSWMPDKYYLDRGTAIHACAAMIAEGIDFDYDPQIDGWVKGCRKFFEDMTPNVFEIETRVESVPFHYAGRLDMFAEIKKKTGVIDWKSGSVPMMKLCLQLAGYAIAHECEPRHGMGVFLNEQGAYKTTGWIDLKPWKPKFLAVRTVFGLMQETNKERKEYDEREDSE